MGKGKGNIDTFIYKVKKGTVILEFYNKSPNASKIDLNVCNARFPVRVINVYNTYD